MTIIGTILGVGILIAGVIFFQAWVIMLVWGAIAGAFDGPTISFWLSIAVSAAIGLLTGGGARASR